MALALRPQPYGRRDRGLPVGAPRKVCARFHDDARFLPRCLRRGHNRPLLLQEDGKDLCGRGMNDTVIKVHNLSKRYTIGDVHTDLLSERIGQSFKYLLNKIRPRKDLSPLTYNLSQEKNFWALKDVSFEIKQGEVVGIIGRNGAGKTTLLKILSRITEPTEGAAEIYGRVGSLLEVGTGFHPELTGRENTYLNGAILGMSRAEIKKKFDEIVAFAEVEKFLDTPVKRYSSGMYVRLAFAVAAHLEPEILLVDEVLAVGDAQFQKKCLGKMGEVAKEGRTVLFVSHNMGAISRLCDRCIFLEDGLLAYNGPVEEAVAKYIKRLPNSETFLKNENVQISVSFRTEDGGYLTVWGYDELLIMTVHLAFNKPINDPAIHIAFYSENGSLIFSYQTEHIEHINNRLSGKKIQRCDFVFRIKNSGLRCDTVNVDVGIAANKELNLIGLWQNIETIPISSKQFEKYSVHNSLFYLPTESEVGGLK
jgi:ABC-type polysaccharide/polyol phosphate transport system ATPase subunit